MSQAAHATTAEQLVSETDHVQLSRLVTEHAWRADNGRADTLPWMVGEDHDRFVRTEHGWKLVSRRWVELFTRGDVVDIP